MNEKLSKHVTDKIEGARMGMTGVGGTLYQLFKAIKAGEGQLVYQYGREWEEEEL